MKKNKTECIYGIHAVESVILNNYENVLQLWVQSGRVNDRINNIIEIANSNNLHIEYCAKKTLDKKCNNEIHQGVVSNVRNIQDKHTIDDFLNNDVVLFLVIDGVQDPHNIGACLRAANAAGVDAVITSKNRTPGLTSVVRKVASGAADSTPYIQVSNLAQTIKKLKESNIWVIGSDSNSNDSIFDCNIPEKCAIVMGSEEKGMRKLTTELCDQLVGIPMFGTVESLNVSVAAGICLFEARRQGNLKL